MKRRSDMGEASIYEKADLARPKSVAEPVAEPQPVESQSAAARDDGRPPVGEIAVSMEATPPAAEAISAPEAAASSRDDHQEEGPVIDNLEFLTEKVPGLSDVVRRALLNVPLDADNPEPAVLALFKGGFNEDEVRATMEQINNALNLRAAPAAPAAEVPVTAVPEQEVASGAVETPTPSAEAASVSPQVERDEFAKRLGPLTLRGTVRVALADADPNDDLAVQHALGQSGATSREIRQVQSLIEELKLRRAPAPAALKNVDLRNAAEVKAALSKFGADTRAQATAQLARFRRAVDAAVAKLPKKPAAKESVAQSAQQQEPEIVVEPQHQTEVSDIEATGFAARFPAAIAAAEQFTDPERLQGALEAARQEYVRTSSGEEELKGVAKDLDQTVRALLRKGASGEEIRQKVSSLADELVIDVNATKDEKSRLQDANRSFLPDALRAVKALLPGENGKLSETAETVQARILFLRGLGNYRQQQEILAKKHAALKNLETSGIRLQDISKKKREEIERGRQRMESNIATMESVDGLLAHPNLPPELERAIQMRLRGEVISHGTDQAAQYRASLDRAIVDALGIEPRPRPAEQPKAAAPEEIPAPERQVEAEPARGAEGQERTDVTVNEKDVEGYASSIREGRANAQQFAESLSEMAETERDQELRTLRAAVDRLTQELQEPNADAQQSARTKENLKKLGFALVGATGLVGLAAVDAIINAIEGAIGETFKIAES